MSTSVVPIIDLSVLHSSSISKEDAQAKVAAELADACKNVGFFIVTGHQVPQEVIEAAWGSARTYFDLSSEEKNKVPMNDDYPYGYSGFGEELLVKGLTEYNKDDRSQSAKTVMAPDLKETFQICIGPKENPHVEMKKPLWPENPSDLQPSFTAYYRQLERLSSEILSCFATALNLPKDWFEDKINQHLSVIRALNYPDLEAPPKPGQMRAGAHTDYGTITILLADDAPGGLELFLNNEWIPVKAPANSFIINLGDLMQRWTNDSWRSTLHRVVPPPIDYKGSTRRQSMAFFHNLNPDAKVSCIESCQSTENPAKYDSITSGEWLMTKHYASQQFKK